MNRRDFVTRLMAGLSLPAGVAALPVVGSRVASLLAPAPPDGAATDVAGTEPAPAAAAPPPAPAPAPAPVPAYDPKEHRYAMAVQVDKCIGCGRCADACKKENDVPTEPFFFRTWIERYAAHEDGEVTVDSPNGGVDGFPPFSEDQEKDLLRSFFVPKLCNHCENPPCVQVCPVGATYTTEDGVVLVDKSYCIGCRYCIQACPYGARYLHPKDRTADKCTFCYHRITKGLLPACVEVCPVEARVFGDLEATASPLQRIMRFGRLQVLKGDLNTKPQVYYTGLDMEVR